MKTRSVISFVAILLLAACGKTYEDRLRECDEVGEFHDGNALCWMDGSCFYINERGTKISKKYADGTDYANGYAIVYTHENENSEGVYHVLNVKGKELEGTYIGVKGNVNKEGNIWVKVDAGSNTDVSNSLNGKTWHLINVETREVLSKDFHLVDCVTENGTAVVRGRHKLKDGMEIADFALISGTGKELIPFGQYGFIGNFYHGLAQFTSTGVFPYRAVQDKEIIDFACLLSDYYSERYVKNEISVKPQPLGYINTKGEVVIPERFAHATHFNERGYARVDFVFSVVQWEKRPLLNLYIDERGELLTGKSLCMARASFLDDGQWQGGRDNDGFSIVSDNKGNVYKLNTKDPVAAVYNYVATRSGKTYTIYKVRDGGLDVMFKIEGSGRNSEVLSMDKDRQFFQINPNDWVTKDTKYNIYGDYCGEAYARENCYYAFIFE